MPNRKKPASAELSLTFDVRTEGLAPVMGAAYLMMDRAYARLDGDPKKSLTVTLRPKDGRAEALPALEEAYRAELESQKLRWRLADENRAIREHVIENAVALANGRPQPQAQAASPEAPADALTAEQRSEIERLIAEVESEIKAMNEKKAPPEAQRRSLSWEEAQAGRKESGAA